jgi:hypothetical protein
MSVQNEGGDKKRDNGQSRTEVDAKPSHNVAT